MNYSSMSDNSARETVPVKDGSEFYKKPVIHESKDDTIQQRRIVCKLPREELEDRFLRVCEDNLLLKRHSRKQEDKIKKMATKLIRLINDHKKQEQGGIQQGRRRDVETEELIEEMQEKIRELDHQNIQLKEKLVATKQQLASHSKRVSPCSQYHGQAHKTISSSTKLLIPKPKCVDDDGFSSPRIEESNNFITSQDINRNEVVLNLTAQLTGAKEEIKSLQYQLRVQQTEYEEQLFGLKSQVKHTQKQNIEENVELIRLQRETKHAQDKVGTLLEQYNKLQENLRMMKSSHDQLVKEVDNLTKQLKDEQTRTLTLQAELQIKASNDLIIAELKGQNAELQKENNIFKDSNVKLMKSAFDVEKQGKVVENESLLQDKVNKLETILRTELQEKDGLLHNLSQQTYEYQKLGENHRTIQNSFIELNKKYEALVSRSSFLAKYEYLDVKDLDEALRLLQAERKGILLPQEVIKEKVTEPDVTLFHDFQELQADHAELVNELEKLRTVLQLQYKINNDYKQEVSNLSNKLLQFEDETETKLRENSQQLDLRSARIRQLEYQLQDLTRGASNTNNVSKSGFERTSERGEMMVEITMKKVVLSEDGVRSLGNAVPTTFLTWSFYDFEIMSSKIIRGLQPIYNSTSQYFVRVDEIFLQYITKEKMSVEFHEATGTDYRTIAAGSISFEELLQMSNGIMHGVVTLTRIEPTETALVLGHADYSISISSSILSALQFYKEKYRSSRVKSDGMIAGRIVEMQDQLSQENSHKRLNELSVTIVQCNGLISTKKALQPSSYCVYRFFDWPDHDTAVIPFSSNPRFNDCRLYQVIMDDLLHNYLLSTTLRVYVFDYTASEDSSYIGVACVPLIKLTENNVVHESFELKTRDGLHGGTLEVIVSWLHPYFIQSRLTSKEVMKENANFVPSQLRSSPPISTHTKKPVALPRTLKQNNVLPNETNSKFIPEEPPFSLPPPVNSTESAMQIKPSYTKPSGERTEASTSGHLDIVGTEIAYLSDFDEDDGKSDYGMGQKTNEKLVEMELGNYSDKSEKTGDFSSSSSEEDVVTSSKSAEVLAEKIVIEVHHLTLFEGSSVLLDSEIQMLFVEYSFLDYRQEEMETPYALPKPQANNSIVFNFHKEFKMDPEQNADKRTLLSNIFRDSNSDVRRIVFTVVSEPPDDGQDLECEDVGHAYVDLKQLLRDDRDLICSDLKLYNAEDPQTVIGTINVTIEALSVLESIRAEI